MLNCLPKWLCHFAFPPAMDENFCCSTSSPAFGEVCFWTFAILIGVLSYLIAIFLKFSLFFSFLIWLCWVLVTACGIWFPGQGWNPGPLHWEHGVLASGLGKFIIAILICNSLTTSYAHHLFMCLFVIYIYFFMRCLSRFCSYFKASSF